MSQICLIIPCYNEGKRLRISAFEDFLDQHPEYDILFVNDGSSDNTDQILARFAAKHSRVYNLSLAKNSGKATAVQEGILYANGLKPYLYLGYLDADLATPIPEIVEMQKILDENSKIKIVLGSRWKRLGAEIHRKWIRHYLGRIFASAVSLLFNLDVYDSQCGAKLLRNDRIDEIFREPFCSPWFFDIEILIRLSRQNPGEIDNWAYEVPLSKWREVGGSRIKMIDFLLVPVQLLRIKWHYRRH
jgi:glycosyltransferase involved in cell wall biosynthesis